MRKITDEGFLFLYGAGLLVTAETGDRAVITILFACIYSVCVYLYLCESGRGRKVSALHYDDCFRGSRNCF